MVVRLQRREDGAPEEFVSALSLLPRLASARTNLDRDRSVRSRHRGIQPGDFPCFDPSPCNQGSTGHSPAEAPWSSTTTAVSIRQQASGEYRPPHRHAVRWIWSLQRQHVVVARGQPAPMIVRPENGDHRLEVDRRHRRVRVARHHRENAPFADLP